ncbi:MAG: hypothetical protein ABWZ83_05650, partial [Mesorhizobium sp.]
MASILFTAFDRNRSITRYSRRRAPFHHFPHAEAPPIPDLFFAAASKAFAPGSRRGCRFGERFTRNWNEVLIEFMGYHGAVWASTGTGYTNQPNARSEPELSAFGHLSSIK